MSDAAATEGETTPEAGLDRPRLTRERVLQAALELVDAEGIEKLSMRRLGAALGVEGMSLYHHVANKEAILDGIVDLIVADSHPDGGVDLDGDEPWTEVMARVTATFRATLLAHPNAVPLLASRGVTTPGSVEAVERMLAALMRRGLSSLQAMTVLSQVSVYTIGVVLAETGRPVDQQREMLEADMLKLRALPEEDFPIVSELVAQEWPDPEMAREMFFALGIRALLTGLEGQFQMFAGWLTPGVTDTP